MASVFRFPELQRKIKTDDEHKRLSTLLLCRLPVPEHLSFACQLCPDIAHVSHTHASSTGIRIGIAFTLEHTTVRYRDIAIGRTPIFARFTMRQLKSKTYPSSKELPCMNSALKRLRRYATYTHSTSKL